MAVPGVNFMVDYLHKDTRSDRVQKSRIRNYTVADKAVNKNICKYLCELFEDTIIKADLVRPIFLTLSTITWFGSRLFWKIHVVERVTTETLIRPNINPFLRSPITRNARLEYSPQNAELKHESAPNHT